MPPICDNTRLILGIIATLGGIVFASMTGILKNDIKALVRRLFHRTKKKMPVTKTKPATPAQRVAKFFGWVLLGLSLAATVGIGPYVASVPSKTCVKLVISELVCDPPGDDLQGEYVKIQNPKGLGINLNNWTLCDYQSRHCYTFKNMTIRAHSTLTLWTKKGTETASDLFFGEAKPIWNNDVDTAYLYDVKGQLIDQLSCP